MVYLETSVASGRGVGVVVATGEDSQIGTIAGQVRETERVATPLQTRMWTTLLTHRSSTAAFSIATYNL
jgi:magnesium-transporting ATPase (P-type)